ncbi:hypothetical protein YC2023_011871 [Brassica napus]
MNQNSLHVTTEKIAAKSVRPYFLYFIHDAISHTSSKLPRKYWYVQLVRRGKIMEHRRRKCVFFQVGRDIIRLECLRETLETKRKREAIVPPPSPTTRFLRSREHHSISLFSPYHLADPNPNSHQSARASSLLPPPSSSSSSRLDFRLVFPILRLVLQSPHECLSMDIDLRLHSGDQGDDSARGLDNVLHNSDIDIGKIEEDVMAATTGELVDYTETVNLEPLNGMEFDSHGEAYAFYQEYSRAIGFNTAIQNSRRSKTTREFIDAKFACSRYGTKREYENKSCNRPRARQSKQDHPESNMAGGCRRTCAKTDCKASMHVKRRSNGKWVIHSFVREHNHELVPAQAVTEQAKAEVSCICRLFEYKGYLCRHTLNVLQCCHLSSVPSQYILKRWTKDARSRQISGEAPQQLQTRMQRYNDLCQRALKLSEEASCSQESYNVAFLAIEEALRNCAGANRSLPDAASSPTQGLVSVEEDNQSRSAGGKTSKKKNPTKKRKVSSEQEVMPQVAAPESLQQMDKLSPRTVGIESYYGTQQSVQTMVQLDLMGGPNRDNFYGNQQTMQGLRQLNSIAPSYDSYYTAQQGIHGQGVDFFRPPNFSYDIRDDPNVRTTQLHEDAPRHS